jgi:hypothetical protein
MASTTGVTGAGKKAASRNSADASPLCEVFCVFMREVGETYVTRARLPALPPSSLLLPCPALQGLEEAQVGPARGRATNQDGQGGQAPREQQRART